MAATLHDFTAGCTAPGHAASPVVPDDAGEKILGAGADGPGARPKAGDVILTEDESQFTQFRVLSIADDPEEAGIWVARVEPIRTVSKLAITRELGGEKAYLAKQLQAARTISEGPGGLR